MADKADWANFSEDEDDDQDEPQEQQEHALEGKTQVQHYLEAYEEDLKAYNQGEETRPSGYGGYGGYSGGGRPERGGRGGRGGGRGRGRGGRGGRGEGPREPREPRDNQRPPKQIMENQPKQEMINLIKRGKDENTFINLFNVDFKATEEDIKSIYPEVKINEVTMIKPGLFLVELINDEALKLVDIGPKIFNQREFYMKLGYSNKRQHSDEQWHDLNMGRHKSDVGHREDRPRRGGGKHYNRREQNPFGDDSPKTRFQNGGRDREYQDRRTSDQQGDTNNKYFQGHDLKASEFKLRFTNSSTKKEDESAQTSQPKAAKPNPFGAAVARDETEYIKRKEDEKKQVKDLQEHFEEKKEQQQPKEQKLKLTAPVNSVDSQNLEPQDERDKKGGNQRYQYEDKSRYNQGGQYGKDYKKSGFTGKGQGQGQTAYEAKAREKERYYGDSAESEGRWQSKEKGGASNKFNKFDALK